MVYDVYQDLQTSPPNLNSMHIIEESGKGIYSRICQSPPPCLLLSTDAEKAFDRVDWVFIEDTLKAINIGPNIRHWIAALYSNPQA